MLAARPYIEKSERNFQFCCRLDSSSICVPNLKKLALGTLALLQFKVGLTFSAVSPKRGTAIGMANPEKLLHQDNGLRTLTDFDE